MYIYIYTYIRDHINIYAYMYVGYVGHFSFAIIFSLRERTPHRGMLTTLYVNYRLKLGWGGPIR